MKTLLSITIIISTVAFCCASNVKDAPKESSDKDNAEIIKYIKPDFEAVKLLIKSDTLSIVSTHDFLYHPFGQFSNIDDFCTKYNWSFKMVPKSEAKTDYKLYKASNNESSVIFILDDEKGSMEIVGGSIKDTNITLINGTKMNIAYLEYLNKLFSKVPEPVKKNLNVIELESGLTGIWHYYTFSKGRLKSIVFKSDYVF
jgi:hypothetical protein